MRIRPYLECKDFDAIKDWITDERTHAFWCAGHTNFPLEKEDFSTLLKEIAEMFGDAPFVATTDEGEVVGFFCYGLNYEKNEGMLKFVVVDGSKRGRGIGKEMIKLALKYAFEITKANTVQLNVFPENERAKKCYESIGFVERNTTPGCFKFKDESWSRCNMVIGK
ncbi:MAG: GNAT family N-acetyltransferase [Lachnospiraceae bacterium]|nr:GNAT family N-acetyltransferase [Lachnospiraceae bacterium]